MIITIDGPSGTGKTTVAKGVAEKLGISYFDTGAMYRAVSWAVLEQGIDPKDTDSMRVLLTEFEYDVRTQDGQKRIFVGDVDVTEAIRAQRINAIVSEVSAQRSVREALWIMQRTYASKQSAVFEGRDMGSAVFPEADLKVYLDASPQVRARRRLDEMHAKQPEEATQFDEATMVEELKRRDKYDASREIAPLKKPKGSLRVDTSNLSIEQVIDNIVDAYNRQGKKLLPGWLHSKKMHLLYRLVILIVWIIFKIFYRHKVYGIEHFTKGAAIVAPNHTSYLDPPIGAISWPEELHFLAKESLFHNYFFGKFIRAVNSHPVRGGAGDASVFKTIIHLLKEGKQVILFPEGGRTEGALRPVKPGIGLLVMRSKSAIVPTYIHGALEVWSVKKKFPKLFGKTACVFGSPIPWASFSHLEKKLAQEEIAKTLERAMADLKTWYEAGAKGSPP